MFAFFKYLITHARFYIDMGLMLLKWPIALLMVASIYPTLQACVFYYQKVFTNWHELMLFGFGFAGMVFVWIFLIGRKNIVAATMEHEITHAIFALLTFHNVTDLRAEFKGGGSTTYRGGTNWLITIAPYFFPTLSLAVILIAVIVYLMTGSVVSWLNIALGLTTGYHFLAVLFEIHPEQTDLKKVGWIFSVLFIPAANLLAYVFILTFVDHGITGSFHFLKILYLFAYHDIIALL